jgi:hypothetical protein
VARAPAHEIGFSFFSPARCWYDQATMFIDGLLKTLKAPLDFVRMGGG